MDKTPDPEHLSPAGEDATASEPDDLIASEGPDTHARAQETEKEGPASGSEEQAPPVEAAVGNQVSEPSESSAKHPESDEGPSIPAASASGGGGRNVGSWGGYSDARERALAAQAAGAAELSKVISSQLAKDPGLSKSFTQIGAAFDLATGTANRNAVGRMNAFQSLNDAMRKATLPMYQPVTLGPSAAKSMVGVTSAVKQILDAQSALAKPIGELVGFSGAFRRILADIDMAELWRRARLEVAAPAIKKRLEKKRLKGLGPGSVPKGWQRAFVASIRAVLMLENDEGVEELPAGIEGVLTNPRFLGVLDAHLGDLDLVRGLEADGDVEEGLCQLAVSLAEYVKRQSEYGELASDDGDANAQNTPEVFFGAHAVTVRSVKELLEVTATIEGMHYEHDLVWRGQQDASWPVHSALHRRFSKPRAKSQQAGRIPTRDEMAGAEAEMIMKAAAFGREARGMELMVELQHYGAPTRLLDFTFDPKVAAYFATEPNPELNEKDGMIFAWGTKAREADGFVEVAPAEFTDPHGRPVWLSYNSPALAAAADWGTGHKVWQYTPNRLNDRIRAQHGTFILDTTLNLYGAGVARIGVELQGIWNPADVAAATSIPGLPLRHDQPTPDDSAGLVPIFTIRVPAELKPEIQSFLGRQHIATHRIYPDMQGLASQLAGPYGPNPSQE